MQQRDIHISSSNMKLLRSSPKNLFLNYLTNVLIIENFFYKTFVISQCIPSIIIYKVFSFGLDHQKYFAINSKDSTFKHKMKIPIPNKNRTLKINITTIHMSLKRLYSDVSWF